MKIKVFLSISIFLFFYGTQALLAQTTTEVPASLSQITTILGRSGQMQDGALVVHYPRCDLKVTIGGEIIPTALGLTSWTEWKPVGSEIRLIGNFVLTENEIAPFMQELERGNIRVTGMYSHFLKEHPRIIFMHVNGNGNADSLATTLKSALCKTATPLKGSALITSPALKLDTGVISRIMGLSGLSSGGVYKFIVTGGGAQSGVETLSSIGLASWVGFMGTNDKAHVAGDLVVSADEVSRAIRTLKSGGIDVVSVHNHVFTEKTNAFILHYWGTGNAQKLARTVAIAFDNVKGPLK